MVMDTLQIRLAPGLVAEIDKLVDSEIYSSRSDVIRDALRRLILDKLVGITSSNKNSVKEVKEIRKQLSKERFNLNEINRLI